MAVLKWVSVNEDEWRMKNILQLIALFLILLFLAAKAEVGAVINANETTSSSVAVTDSTTHWQSTLTDSKKLNSFNYYWSQKQLLHAQKSQAYQWRYQLQIQDNDKTSKWVYDPRGYAREVTISPTSKVYQLNTARAFNRFLNALSKHPETKENNNNE
ncbi:MAG: hypothetical protein ACI9N9_002210 [Enterobacterales bacterium]|jgi:hypothetical protein